MAAASVEVSDLSVDFPLYHGTSRSLKRRMFSTVSGGRMGADAKNRVVVQALRDLTFSLSSGDRLGLIGQNGAGKTTLLRTLAGIYEPVTGRVHVEGTINALLDPSLGMNLDLTGRENITLRGLYNGLDEDEIKRLEADVESFAGLGEFMNLPIRIYSSGMMVRLGFALATSIRPQVLLMDEWFLAGDAMFMEKARVRLEDMVRGSEILVLSSHSEGVVMEWCTRVIWMDQGRIRMDGPPDIVLEAYLGRPPVRAQPVKPEPETAIVEAAE
ncbi:MAG TPA: ABC transporter ATP-binding protein [Acetobacteraceae bacterium]|jgi:lipopolysaccharide transport system ATP-binding protein|nr:ABC transporter ATP-binding protein [Acetobacteraceae bacterium]